MSLIHGVVIVKILAFRSKTRHMINAVRYQQGYYAAILIITVIIISSFVLVLFVFKEINVVIMYFFGP